jgi:hypothetical protein
MDAENQTDFVAVAALAAMCSGAKLRFLLPYSRQGESLGSTGMTQAPVSHELSDCIY